jgi:hypothetical protein
VLDEACLHDRGYIHSLQCANAYLPSIGQDLLPDKTASVQVVSYFHNARWYILEYIYIATLGSLKHPWSSSPKNFRSRRCRRSNLDQNLPRITDPVSDLTGRGPVVLCDFSKLRFWKSPYDFLNLYGRFCPYTHHTTPGMTHCHQIYTSKYLRNAKKLDVSR